MEAGRKAAHLAALNVLAVARQHLGSLDKVTRIVQLGVSVATSGDVRDQPKVADAASELLQDVTSGWSIMVMIRGSAVRIWERLEDRGHEITHREALSRACRTQDKRQP
jgi:hypothetical protein